MDWNVKEHRIRCHGHILNLAAQAFLQVQDPELLEPDNDASVENTCEQVDIWKKHCAIGRLHRFVVRMQKSPQRYHLFLVMSQGKHLPRDNSTRWNSLEKMISTAIELRRAIERFQLDDIEQEDMIITERDWVELEKVR
jgi:hypothetical protein